MNKTTVILFGISIPAGVLYMGYQEGKKYQIKKLIDIWKTEAAGYENDVDEEKLKEDLDQFNAFDVVLMKKYLKSLSILREKGYGDEKRVEQFHGYRDRVKKKGLYEKIHQGAWRAIAWVA